MTDVDHTLGQVARLARVRDDELAGTGTGEAAGGLLDLIVSGRYRAEDPAAREPAAAAAGSWFAPARGRRWFAPVQARRRLALAAAVVVVATATAVLGPALVEDGTGPATSYANSAIEITREDGFLVARIKDPLADQERYREAFRAFGKDVAIELVPVPPQLVGRLLAAGGERGGGATREYAELVPTGPQPVDCALVPAACTIVVHVSVDTRGPVRYTFGRTAQPGEEYRDPGGVPQRPGAGEPSGTGAGPGAGEQPTAGDPSTAGGPATVTPSSAAGGGGAGRGD